MRSRNCLSLVPRYKVCSEKSEDEVRAQICVCDFQASVIATRSSSSKITKAANHNQRFEDKEEKRKWARTPVYVCRACCCESCLEKFDQSDKNVGSTSDVDFESVQNLTGEERCSSAECASITMVRKGRIGTATLICHRAQTRGVKCST